MRDALLKVIADADAHEDLWWKSENGGLEFFINCNDLFAWGCSDCEEVLNDADVDLLEQAYKDSEFYGGWLYCCRKRGCRPQGACYTSIPEEEWQHFHACGPERKTGFGNPYSPGEYVRPTRALSSAPE